MSVLKRLLLVTFIESLGVILVERGIYFYTHEHLSFDDTMNLAVALGLGLAYVVGALASSPVSARLGEKRLIQWAIVGQFLCHAAPVVVPSSAMVFVVAVGIGLFNGLKWPVVESFVAAGRTQKASAHVIGVFNIAWSTSVPLALFVAGPLLTLPMSDLWLDQGAPLFIFAGTINLLSLVLLRPIADSATHMPDEHPDRPGTEQKVRLGAMLVSSRWSLLATFCMLFVVAPLMPTILTDRLGVPPAWAPTLSSVIDVVRVVAFVVLWRTSGWHDRPILLVMAACMAPVGFFLIVTGSNLVLVLVGQVIFGAAMGMAYYAALYYAMMVKNASVDAGGVHEG